MTGPEQDAPVAQQAPDGPPLPEPGPGAAQEDDASDAAVPVAPYPATGSTPPP